MYSVYYATKWGQMKQGQDVITNAKNPRLIWNAKGGAMQFIIFVASDRLQMKEIWSVLAQFFLDKP